MFAYEIENAYNAGVPTKGRKSSMKNVAAAKQYMIMAVLVQIPTVCAAPKSVGTRTGNHTHSATPHTSGRCVSCKILK